MTSLKNVTLSLTDLLGDNYIESAVNASAYLTGRGATRLRAIADEKVEFCPQSFVDRMNSLVDNIGRHVVEPLSGSAGGAATNAFVQATKGSMAPVGGLGFTRIGEDGRLYLLGKSEHYHASLGHNFPGYRLLENAARLGISNISHNNTRGHITRLLEETLIRVANGLEAHDTEALRAVIDSEKPHVMNRVINLETGSLAMEASVKMCLSRFYRLDATFPEPRYANRTPVFFVLSDFKGGRQANYHGTTIFTQMMRDLWPGLCKEMEDSRQFLVKPVRINDLDDFRAKMSKWDNGDHKVAGFLHEIVLMNYGGIRIDKGYIQKAHELCKEHDVPTIVDEIQSCMWSPELFLYKEYGLTPDFVSVGKGFPGGQYPASKILTTAAMDNLNQFGALVTNGQEELASLAYLITIRFAEENAAYTAEIGASYENGMRALAADHTDLVNSVEGWAHMTTLFFNSAKRAEAFSRVMNQDYCMDVSAQTYKADCPPAALTKLPLIITPKAVRWVIDHMAKALQKVRE